MYSASFLPLILVPFSCLLIPGLASVFMLLYIERDDIG